MSHPKKIQVELTEDEARAFADIPLGDGDPDTLVRAIRDKVAAALPPEYPEGTVAWVTTSHERRDTPDRTILCAFRDGQWRIGDTKVVPVGDVIKVEPLRVLADDEYAVDAEVLASLASMWRESANTRSFITARYGPLAHRIDQLVDAEATP